MRATRDIERVLREQIVPAGVNRYGVVVGVERYRDERLNLRCARADAQAIYNLMVDSECGLFPKDNVKLLLDEQATTDNVWRSLSGLRKLANASDMVWIFFAGHAALEGSSLFWVTHDADIDDLFGSALESERIQRVISGIQASRVVTMLDCCHAAATACQKNPTRAVLTPDELFAAYKGEGRITLASSDGKEKSVELGDHGHGAFTYFLKQGLRGEADSNGDGVVTANELWDYLRNKVSEASLKAGNCQTPVLIGQMTHDLPLTLNPLATQRKRRLEEVLRANVGWDEKNDLSTEEARWCSKLIHDGPETEDEWAVYEELERLAEGKALIGTIKRLLKMVRGAEAANAVGTVASAPDTPVSRVCPSCGKFLRVQSFCAGQDVPCPGCKTLLHVAIDRSILTIAQPAPSTPALPDEPPALPDDPPALPDEPQAELPAPTPVMAEQSTPEAKSSAPKVAVDAIIQLTPVTVPSPKAPAAVTAKPSPRKASAKPRKPAKVTVNQPNPESQSTDRLTAEQKVLFRWVAGAAAVSLVLVGFFSALMDSSKPDYEPYSFPQTDIGSYKSAPHSAGTNEEPAPPPPARKNSHPDSYNESEDFFAPPAEDDNSNEEAEDLFGDVRERSKTLANARRFAFS